MKKFLAPWLVMTTTFPSSAVQAGEGALDFEDGLKPAYLNQSKKIFERPNGISISREGAYLLIADTGAGEIKVLDTGKLRQLSRFGKGEMSNPADLSFNRRGELFVADTGNDRVLTYRFDGVYRDGDPNIEKLGELTEGIDKPSSVAGGVGNRVYVTNGGNNTVVMLDEGKLLKTVKDAGGAPLASPADVHHDHNGRVIVSDRGNKRVLIFDRDLNLLSVLATNKYGFQSPGRIASDENGLMLVVDSGPYWVRITDKDNAAKGRIASDSSTPVPPSSPAGVESVGRYMWITGAETGRVTLFKRQ